MEWKQLTEKTLRGSLYLWLVMKKSSISCTQRSTYSQILYCVLERWPRTLNQILHGKTDWCGSKVHQNTELWTQLMVSQWNSSGIFPRIHHIAARRQSSRVQIQNGRPSAIPRTNYLHVDVHWHHMETYRQWKRMRIKCSSEYRILDTIDGEPMEFEWNISQDSPHCSSSIKFKSSNTNWATQRNSKAKHGETRIGR